MQSERTIECLNLLNINYRLDASKLYVYIQSQLSTSSQNFINIRGDFLNKKTFKIWIHLKLFFFVLSPGLVFRYDLTGVPLVVVLFNAVGVGRIFWQFFENSSVNSQPILLYYVSKCLYDQNPHLCRRRFLIFDFKKILGGENPLFWRVEPIKIFINRARCMKFGIKVYIRTLINIIKKNSNFSKRGSFPPP